MDTASRTACFLYGFHGILPDLCCNRVIPANSFNNATRTDKANTTSGSSRVCTTPPSAPLALYRDVQKASDLKKLLRPPKSRHSKSNALERLAVFFCIYSAISVARGSLARIAL